MKVILLFCLFTTSLSFPGKKSEGKPRILVSDLKSAEGQGQGVTVIGGVDAPAHSQPHQVSLQYRGALGWTHFCGGSIINQTKIATAAHCVVAAGGSTSGFRVVAGEHDLSVDDGAEQVRNWKYANSHPLYDFETIDWDYGVITLDAPLAFNSNVQPIPLARTVDEPQGNCVTSGWGKTFQDSDVPNILQQIGQSIVSREKCAEIYSSIEWGITERMICAGGELGHGICGGDSGGPLVCEGSAGKYLAGITSYTMEPCGELPFPSGWANVAYGRDWLLEH